jgi:hypothetical protein
MALARLLRHGLTSSLNVNAGGMCRKCSSKLSPWNVYSLKTALLQRLHLLRSPNYAYLFSRTWLPDAPPSQQNLATRCSTVSAEADCLFFVSPAQPSMLLMARKRRQYRAWGDGSPVKITCCSSRGPGFKSQHLFYNSSSWRSAALFWPLLILHACCTEPNKQAKIHMK